MKYQEIKTEHETRLNALLTECLVFWAFSNQQFQENKTPLQEGEKYVSIGVGGNMPKSKVDQFNQGMKILAHGNAKRLKSTNSRTSRLNMSCIITMFLCGRSFSRL